MIHARLRLFGEPSLTGGPDLHAGPIDLPRQVEPLLAYLALHSNQPIDRRKLAFILWADTTEAIALRNLRQHLHRLRQILASLQLPDEILASQGSQLCFKPGAALWIDVTHFERQITDQRWQIEAIELYRGDLLATYDAEWIIPRRSRLRDQYLNTLRGQITIATMQRNYPRALHYARRLLDATPLRESSHRIYMEALYFNGQRVQALQHFSHLADLLKRDLNTGPMSQTVMLYRQIQNGTLSGDIPPAIASSQQAPQALTTISQISASFVGRRAELARLDETLARTMNGWGRFILIAGDSGIGKTHLLHIWQQARAEQLLLFSGQAQIDESGIPGAPVLEALQAGRDHIDWQWFPSRSPWMDMLPSLLNDPGDTRPGAAHTDAQGVDWPSADRLGQFILTLAARAGRPVGLLLDDLHNADETTWQLLAFLARRCSTNTLLVVGTYQPDSLPPAAQWLLHSLQRQRQLETIELWPLSPADTTRLATHLLPQQPEPDKSFLNHLYRVTEGNPFFITEFLKAAQPGHESWPNLETPVPRTVQAVIGARLDRLTARSRHLLAIAAAIGRAFNFRVLDGAAPQHPHHEVLEALEDWLDQGLVVEKSDGYEFKHEQIQQAAYAILTPAERRQAHQAIARALIILPLEPRLRDPARLAYHYLNSNTPEQALPDLAVSGKRALAMTSLQEATGLARQCLNLTTNSNFRDQVADLTRRLEQALEPPEKIDRAYAILDKIVEIWLNQ